MDNFFKIILFVFSWLITKTYFFSTKTAWTILLNSVPPPLATKAISSLFEKANFYIGWLFRWLHHCGVIYLLYINHIQNMFLRDLKKYYNDYHQVHNIRKSSLVLKKIWEKQKKSKKLSKYSKILIKINLKYKILSSKYDIK